MEENVKLKFNMESESDSQEIRMYKSKLFQAAKKAQQIFEYLNPDSVEILEEWMKSSIISACDDLEKVCQSLEYEMAYPSKEQVTPEPEDNEQERKENNNYLTNEDKRYPVPQEAESGDQFMGRCLADANMKNRYPQQSDRFMACMIIMNKTPENVADNPGEKFEDPMTPPETEIKVVKPILP
jgi:hypothetical protein